MVGSSGSDSEVSSCLLILINSFLRWCGSIRTGVNFPVLWTSKYCLIRVISFWSYLMSSCTLEWWIRNSRHRKMNLLTVNNGTNCFFSIFPIVSFRLDIVPMISLIFIMFWLIKPLDILLLILCHSIFPLDLPDFHIIPWLAISRGQYLSDQLCQKGS